MTGNDYTDHKTWLVVEDWGNEFYLEDCEKYHPDYLVGLFRALIQKAEAKGLEGCYLKFQSSREPYEDYLGSPSVVVAGYRKHSVSEKEEIKKQMFIEKLAEELGVSIYEAGVVQSLKERGKL